MCKLGRLGELKKVFDRSTPTPVTLNHVKESRYSLTKGISAGKSSFGTVANLQVHDEDIPDLFNDPFLDSGQGPAPDQPGPSGLDPTSLGQSNAGPGSSSQSSADPGSLGQAERSSGRYEGHEISLMSTNSFNLTDTMKECILQLDLYGTVTKTAW